MSSRIGLSTAAGGRGLRDVFRYLYVYNIYLHKNRYTTIILYVYIHEIRLRPRRVVSLHLPRARHKGTRHSDFYLLLLVLVFEMFTFHTAYDIIIYKCI